MTRRQQLTEVQLAALYDAPAEQRELVRHYTLSEADLAAVGRCRGDHNRLGFALMLCHLRHPGRPIRAAERPPAALVKFVAEQIDVLPEVLDEYLQFDQNRRRHSAELQERLRLRPYGTLPAAKLSRWLLPHAVENDRLVHLSRLVVEACRQRRIILPPPRTLERLCIDVRYEARREVRRRLTDGLTLDQRRQLDELTQRREETSQTWLAWLRQMPEAAKPAAMLGLIERLKHLREVGLDQAHGHRVHQSRLAQLAREAARTTA